MGDIIHIRHPVKDTDEMLESFKSLDLDHVAVVALKKDGSVELGITEGLTLSQTIGFLEIIKYELLMAGADEG